MNRPLPGAIVRVDTTIGGHHIDDCAVIEHAFSRRGEVWLVLAPWVSRWPCDSVTVRAAAVQVIAERPGVAR